MIRYYVAAIALIALVGAGWKVAEWRYEAAAADMIRTQLAVEMSAKIKAQADARILSEKLRIAESNVHVQIKEIVKRVVVNRSVECAIPVDTLRMLNEARGVTVMPNAPHPDDGPTVIPDSPASGQGDDAGSVHVPVSERRGDTPFRTGTVQGASGVGVAAL